VTAGYIDFDVDTLRDAQQRVNDFIMSKTTTPEKTDKKPERHLRSVA
jgi:hypothetical protein